MGYKFQFITLGGFRALNASMFDLARGYREGGMTAYCKLQDQEFASERDYGYLGVKNQRFTGTGYFDAVQQVVVSGAAIPSSAIPAETALPEPKTGAEKAPTANS